MSTEPRDDITASNLRTGHDPDLLFAILTGWLQRHQQWVITYLHEENRVLKAQRRGRRLCLTDMERSRLAALAYQLGRKRLQEVATIASPDTLLRWYRQLIAQKFDSSRHRRGPGRPRVLEEIEQLTIRMAEENPSRGYRRLQGALVHLGYRIHAGTVRNILHRYHLDPAPLRDKAGMSWAQFLTLHAALGNLGPRLASSLWRPIAPLRGSPVSGILSS